MDEEILDNFTESEESIYAQKAVQFFVTGFCLYLGLFTFRYFIFKYTGATVIFPLLGIGMGIFCSYFAFLGLKNGIKSIRYNEPSFWKKYLFTFLNFLLIIVLLLILFASLVDFMSFF